MLTVLLIINLVTIPLLFLTKDRVDRFTIRLVAVSLCVFNMLICSSGTTTW